MRCQITRFCKAKGERVVPAFMKKPGISLAGGREPDVAAACAGANPADRIVTLDESAATSISRRDRSSHMTIAPRPRQRARPKLPGRTDARKADDSTTFCANTNNNRQARVEDCIGHTLEGSMRRLCSDNLAIFAHACNTCVPRGYQKSIRLHGFFRCFVT